MSQGVESYPLYWPTGWPREKHPRSSRFGKGSHRKPSTAASIVEVFGELRLLGAGGVVVSTNVELRLDGLPYSNRKEPDDAGVAVYFDLDGNAQCIPCDKWDRVGCNLHAVAMSIAALRGLERWGAKEMVAAAFRGFKALPESGSGNPWWETLGLPAPPQRATIADVELAFRDKAKAHHPDRGGDLEDWQALCDARRQAMDAVGG